jgi:hypothetical protein
MKSLTDLQTPTLEWRRVGAGALAFELGTKDQVVATLTILDEGKALARIETAEGTWTARHAGLLASVLTLREEGSSTNLATFHPHPLRHGRLEFADGATFDWVSLPGRAAGAGSGGAFLDREGMPLVRLHAHPAKDLKAPTGPDHGEVELGLAPMARWRHALLAALGWYILVFDQMRERQAVAAEICLRL